MYNVNEYTQGLLKRRPFLLATDHVGLNYRLKRLTDSPGLENKAFSRIVSSPVNTGVLKTMKKQNGTNCQINNIFIRGCVIYFVDWILFLACYLV